MDCLTKLYCVLLREADMIYLKYHPNLHDQQIKETDWRCSFEHLQEGSPPISATNGSLPIFTIPTLDTGCFCYSCIISGSFGFTVVGTGSTSDAVEVVDCCGWRHRCGLLSHSAPKLLKQFLKSVDLLPLWLVVGQCYQQIRVLFLLVSHFSGEVA